MPAKASACDMRPELRLSACGSDAPKRAARGRQDMRAQEILHTQVKPRDTRA